MPPAKVANNALQRVGGGFNDALEDLGEVHRYREGCRYLIVENKFYVLE